jgi:hypothetical protein
MNEQEVNKKFDDIIQPKVITQVVKERRAPAKFPELRYLWGISLLGSFVLIVIVSVISSLIEGWR